MGLPDHIPRLERQQGAAPRRRGRWKLRDVFENGNHGKVVRAAPGGIQHYPCHYHPPISSITIGDDKLMRHLNSGEAKLFNIGDDYREQHDLYLILKLIPNAEDPNVPIVCQTNPASNDARLTFWQGSS